MIQSINKRAMKRPILIKISELKQAAHNPASRVKSGNLTKLKESVSEYGLINPIKITSDGEIIDGHRRVAVFQKLGIIEIAATVENADREENDKIFTTLNTTSRPNKNKDWLEIGMKSGYLQEEQLVLMNELKFLIGDNGIKELFRLNLGLHIYILAKNIYHLIPNYELSDLIMVLARNKLTSKVAVIQRLRLSNSQKSESLNKMLSSIKGATT